jgi:hypothetical protein
MLRRENPLRSLRFKTPLSRPDLLERPEPGIIRGNFLFLYLLPFLLAGCGAGDRIAADGVVFRDSAGIRIIENTAPAWSAGEAWKLADAPALSIGVIDGDAHYQFFRMVGAWRFADGRLAVVDGGAHELRLYDAAGRFLAASGGRGGGPGEFQQIDRLFVAGDSLRISDRALQRVSIFTADGGFVRSFGLPKLEESPMPEPRGWFVDGSFLIDATIPFWEGEPQTGVQLSRAAYYRLSPAGVVLDELGVFEVGQHYIEVDDRGLSSIGLPFARRSATAVGAERFYFGTSESYEIQAFRPDGQLEALIRRLHENLAVRPEDLSNYIRERQRYVSGENARRRMETMFRGLPLPATMPAYGSMLLDAEGNLSVEEYPPPGTERPRWAVFDGEGRWLGTVELPARFEPFQIGTDFILGRRVDELDVQYLEQYRLVR